MGFRWPEPCFGVPEAERQSRIKATSDTCSIDDEAFFIRGIILIPIKGRDDHFGLGVRVSQSRYLGAEDDGTLSGQQSAPSDKSRSLRPSAIQGLFGGIHPGSCVAYRALRQSDAWRLTMQPQAWNPQVSNA